MANVCYNSIMKKKYLDNLYKTTLEERSVLALSLPIALLYRYIFSKNAHLLQTNYNLTHSEIDVLAVLYNYKNMTPTDLYEATIFSSGGMTKILKKLEQKQFISRVPSNKDKRSKLVKLESKGEEIFNLCLVNILKIDNQIFSILDEKEKKSFEKILKKLVYSMLK